MQADFSKVPITELAEINPPVSVGGLSDDSFVSFIPMADVSDKGQWTNRQTRKLREVISWYTIFKESDVLFAKITPCMENGKGCHAVGLESDIGFGSTEFHVLRAKSSADPRFVFHWTQSEMLRRSAEAKMIGSAGQQRVPTDFFETFEVLLFDSDEQRRIAEVLDAVGSAIQRTDMVINKLKWMKAGLLQDLLTRGLDRDGQLRDPVRHPAQFKDSPLGLIPKEWKVEKLMLRVSLPNGQLDPRRDPYRNWPLIAPDHIESGTGRLLSIQTAAEQNAISGKYGFEPGDVLYSKIRPYLQKAILADRRGLCSADMYPLRPDSNMDSRYLLALILSEHFTRFATAVSMRSGFPKINRDELEYYEAAIPDHEEQKRIATVLDSQDARIRTEEASHGKLIQLKKGLMHDLLTGQVRVPAAKSGVVAV